MFQKNSKNYEDLWKTSENFGKSSENLREKSQELQRKATMTENVLREYFRGFLKSVRWTSGKNSENLEKVLGGLRGRVPKTGVNSFENFQGISESFQMFQNYRKALGISEKFKKGEVPRISEILRKLFKKFKNACAVPRVSEVLSEILRKLFENFKNAYAVPRVLEVLSEKLFGVMSEL